MDGLNEKQLIMSQENPGQGIHAATTHALGWLVIGNGIGVLLSMLLLFPNLNLGALTYGRWTPLHLNAQLYGWTALPLIAWLFSIYEVQRSKYRHWAVAAVWGWSCALGIGSISWLAGTNSGKIFLDWRNGSLWVFVIAMIILWFVLGFAWIDGKKRWYHLKKWFSGIGILGLALVPIAVIIAASPSVYPPVDHTTGGPTGSSLLGSSLIVIAIMMLLPRCCGLPVKPSNPKPAWVFFATCLSVFSVTEISGGTHFDAWQIAAMLCLLPWVWIIPKDWNRFTWPEETLLWRVATQSWWAVLVISGVLMFLPGILDHLKFTHALVAHSHLAMAGFTTSFCALLIVIVTNTGIGGKFTICLWNAAAMGMIIVLGWIGWREGDSNSWMICNPAWRQVGLVLRTIFGTVMFIISVLWLIKWRRK